MFSLKNFKANLYDNRLTYSILLLITISAFLVRAQFALEDGQYQVFFSSDDHGHCWRSGMNESGLISFKEILNRSYLDAHPPLRNIVLNFIIRSTNNIFDFRLVSLIPGILVIPLSFLLSKSFFSILKEDSKYANLISLFITCIFAFSHNSILHSIGTRPYALMFLFQTCTFITLFQYIKNQKSTSIILFYLFSFLALISDYSSLMSISVLTLVMLYHVFKKAPRKSFKLITIIGALFLCSVTIFQFQQMNSKSIEKNNQAVTALESNLSLDQMKNVFIRNPQDLVESLNDFVTGFFSVERGNPRNIFSKISSFLNLILYLIGLIYFWRSRAKILFFLSLSPLLMGIVLSYLQVFPLSGTRHCTYLLIHILLSYIAALNILSKIKPELISRALLLIIITTFFYNSRIFLPGKQYQNLFCTQSKYHLGTMKKKELEQIMELVVKKKKSNYQIFIAPHLRERLKIYLDFARFKLTKDSLEFKELKESREILYEHTSIFNNKESKPFHNKVILIGLGSYSLRSPLKSLQSSSFLKITKEAHYVKWSYYEFKN